MTSNGLPMFSDGSNAFMNSFTLSTVPLHIITLGDSNVQMFMFSLFLKNSDSHPLSNLMPVTVSTNDSLFGEVSILTAPSLVACFIALQTSFANSLSPFTDTVATFSIISSSSHGTAKSCIWETSSLHTASNSLFSLIGRMPAFSRVFDNPISVPI